MYHAIPFADRVRAERALRLGTADTVPAALAAAILAEREETLTAESEDASDKAADAAANAKDALGVLADLDRAHFRLHDGLRDLLAYLQDEKQISRDRILAQAEAMLSDLREADEQASAAYGLCE